MSNLNIDCLIDDIKNKEKCLDEEQVKELCEKVKEILLNEPNVVYQTSPIIVCGDIHGQFHDLLELFKKGGELPKVKYLFMGDYVDRGYNGIETIQLLFLYKIKYKDQITLLRGNHECRQTSYQYGFYEECNRKYGNPNVWIYLNDTFDYLPLAATIDNKIFCVHGGLSPFIPTIDNIRLIQRKSEIPLKGEFSDLVWSDPDDLEGWIINPRGAGWNFGSKVVEEFNRINGLDLICRSHQLCQKGFKYWFNDKLITVWSAPNYCYRCGNKSIIFKVNNCNSKEIIEFDESKLSKEEKNYKSLVPYFL